MSKTVPMRKSQPTGGPVTLEVVFIERSPERFALAASTDWAVMFEDVLEVKTAGESHYFPLAQIRRWTVTPVEKEPHDG